jgi:hypothetical protein
MATFARARSRRVHVVLVFAHVVSFDRGDLKNITRSVMKVVRRDQSFVCRATSFVRSGQSSPACTKHTVRVRESFAHDEGRRTRDATLS